jgi:hypothetical protein
MRLYQTMIFADRSREGVRLALTTLASGAILEIYPRGISPETMVPLVLVHVSQSDVDQSDFEKFFSRLGADSSEGERAAALAQLHKLVVKDKSTWNDITEKVMGRMSGSFDGLDGLLNKELQRDLEAANKRAAQALRNAGSGICLSRRSMLRLALFTLSFAASTRDASPELNEAASGPSVLTTTSSRSSTISAWLARNLSSRSRLK